MDENEIAQKLIDEFIWMKDILDYVNLNEYNKYLGWTSNFNFDLPNGKNMHLNLSKENDLFLLFALAVAWSRTGPWENAAALVAYLKIEKKDNPAYWLNRENIEHEKSMRSDNALKTKNQLIGFSPRKKISFRKDIFESLIVLAENWDEIKKCLASSSEIGNYIPFMEYLRSIEGLAGESRRMNIKIPLILRELRCQYVYDNIPGELCCVPDERVFEACKNLNINLPKFKKRDIGELISISSKIYRLFGDLYDLPLFAYLEPEMEKSLYKELIEIDRINKEYNYPFTENKDDVNVLTEEELKKHIITPILNCLGWDDDWKLNVDSGYRKEYSCKGTGRVDYALMYEETPKVFIECKKGDIKLINKKQLNNAINSVSTTQKYKKRNPKEQLSEYTQAVPVEFAVLTNGFEWHFYLPLESGLKRFHTIKLDNPKKEIVSEFIDLLSHDKVIGKNYMKIKE